MLSNGYVYTCMHMVWRVLGLVFVFFFFIYGILMIIVWINQLFVFLYLGLMLWTKLMNNYIVFHYFQLYSNKCSYPGCKKKEVRPIILYFFLHVLIPVSHQFTPCLISLHSVSVHELTVLPFLPTIQSACSSHVFQLPQELLPQAQTRSWPSMWTHKTKTWSWTKRKGGIIQ